MNNVDVEKIVQDLKGFIVNDNSPSNYEYNLLMNKAKYLDLFVQEKSFPPFEVEIQMSSSCNLKCRWCIGDSIQKQSKVKGLSNDLNRDTMEKLIDGILDFKQNDLEIQLVKFSGFIGEPLVKKDATIRSIQRLIGAGLKVGLFTNGTLMDKETWNTLCNIHYINVSLDGGPYSFFWLKESPENMFTTKTFNTVIENISGLNRVRKARNTDLNITVSYVIVPGNHMDIYETTKLVKEAGSDGIRFKCDIGGKHKLKEDEIILKEAYEQIRNVENDFKSESFKISLIHSENDARNEKYKSWDCKSGCFYHNFVGTVGSNGNLYLCDHDTKPGAIHFGSVVNETFQEIWESDTRKSLSNIIPTICRCEVCPPFANKANFFLKKIYDAKNQYGPDLVIEAMQRLRDQFMNIQS